MSLSWQAPLDNSLLLLATKACLSPNGSQRYLYCDIVAASKSSMHANVALTNSRTDPPCRQRPSQRHFCHIRPRRCHRAHQSRQHRRFQHRDISRYRHPHGILHHLHLNHHLAQARRRAALAIAIQHGPRVWALHEHCCAGVALLGVCDSVLPQCACSTADDGGYELVGCCFPCSGGIQRGILCCVGEKELCWASGVC